MSLTTVNKLTEANLENIVKYIQTELPIFIHSTCPTNCLLVDRCNNIYWQSMTDKVIHIGYLLYQNGMNFVDIRNQNEMYNID